MSPGQLITIGGKSGLPCKVKAIYEDKVVVECLDDYELMENQVIDVPGFRQGLEHHVLDNLKELCAKYTVNKVGLSFVNSGQDVRDLRYALDSNSNNK